MQTYTTQMDAARKGIITPQMELVAQKEYRTTEEIRQWVAEGKVAIQMCIRDRLSTMHSATRAESSLWVRVVCFIWNSAFLLTRGGCVRLKKAIFHLLFQ